MRSDRDASDNPNASDDLEASDDGTPFPDCPHCDDPVLFTVVTGPQTGTVEPCGCSVPPALLASLGED